MANLMIQAEHFEYPFETEAHEAFETYEVSGEVLTEEEVDELAAELLSVQSEEELDQFFGKAFKKIGKGLKKVGGTLVKGLKAVAPVALPALGKIAGTALGGPLGGMIGGKLGSLAGNLVGKAELEAMSGEEREFEVARRFVRFAERAAQNAAAAPPSQDAESVALEAMTQAAQGGGAAQRNAGRWVRRGRKIVVYL